MSPVQQKRGTVKEVEIAMIEAATHLALGQSAKAPSAMIKAYRDFYEAIVAAYHNAFEPAKK